MGSAIGRRTLRELPLHLLENCRRNSRRWAPIDGGAMVRSSALQQMDVVCPHTFVHYDATIWCIKMRFHQQLSVWLPRIRLINQARPREKVSPARVRNNLGNDPYKVDLQFAFRQHSTPRRTIRLQCSVCKVFDFSSLFEQATGRFDRPNQDKSQKVLFPSTTTASEIRRRQDVVPLSKIHTMSFIVHLRRCWCSRSILPPPICHPRIAKPHQLQRTEWTPPTPPK